MRYLLIIYLWSLSNFLTAEEIPTLVQQDPKTLEWHWTLFSVSGEASNLTSFFADFTKQSKTSDGTIFLPWAIWDVKNNRWKSATIWSRINCEKNTIDSPGTYERGLFSEPNPVIYSDSSIAAAQKHMICGVNTQDGDKIYGLFATNSGSTPIYWGWVPELIKKEDINNFQLSLTLYQYDPYSAKKGFSSAYITDCMNKKFIAKDPKDGDIDLSDKKFISAIYALNSVCEFRNKLISQTVSPAVETSKGHNRTNEEPQPKKGSEKVSLENAKIKCEQLGFKPKTEKFGSCVLELVK